ncbi:NAD(P)/FAD-dependent oxidoreductase [Ruficoccus amylovorans]|uniref:NAD(P)/FAD-dependent oxidoreductase n=1 Tax=Ruficoccus amylovorans TaxID=1804625 RepID=A0A842HE91_9BACT|nr:FAD-binding protein [Ruficoccus amylovorans]MBC2594752.1 NAD(P)/FAD-dependent oxidoreductase [Ruficoccus amylovorans]
MAERYDTIIIGAGFAGLSAGIRLAQFQKRVLILESHVLPGGLNSYYFRGKGQLYNSGLHTVTNFNARNRRWGFGLICRNLGIDARDFRLAPPKHPSALQTPAGELLFGNDLEILRGSVRDKFPAEIGAFDRFCEDLKKPQDAPTLQRAGSRELLGEYFNDPHLIDLLEMPVYIYGGYREGQIDAATFGTVFRSIFLEGCGSPPDIKHVLDLLIARFKSLGGELKFRRRVARILSEDGRFRGVELADGTQIEAGACLSSAGLAETGLLAGETWGRSGDLSVFETVVAMNRPLDQLGVDRTLLMVSLEPEFHWRAPEGRQEYFHLTLAASDNYAFAEAPSVHHLKIGCFQSGTHWLGLDAETYQHEKNRLEEKMLGELTARFPGLLDEPAAHHESLTPKTVVHYTSHLNGGIYGGSVKSFDGGTPLPGLFVIGNDQAGIGIMGALTSGVIVANYKIILPGQ